MAERLNGMYAFAIWDGRTEKLVMVRDRMGIKPLYYYPTPDGVLFGSEPKAILANPLAEHTVTLDGLRELFAFVKTPGQAVWDGMREVEPGTVVTVDARGLRTTRYWLLRTRAHVDDLDATVAHVRELLDDIVRRQLVADVPRCTLLSGGLDSSALTAIAAALLAERGERVRSFAVDFVGQTENFVPDEMRGTPDAPYVHEVVARLSDRAPGHRPRLRTSSPTPRSARRLLRARDVPVGLGDMDASLYLLFKAIREHSTVALSGESADEVFGGYRSSSTRGAGARTPSRGSCSVRRHTGADAHPHAGADAGRWIWAGTSRTRYDDLGGGDRTAGRGGGRRVDRMREICYLHLTRFVRILLDRKDRMSMALGLEVRVPFCDHRLVEYVYNTPWSMKTFDGREKSLLRGAAARPAAAVGGRPGEEPYPSTQDPQYVAALQAQAKDLLGSSDENALFGQSTAPRWSR